MANRDLFVCCSILRTTVPLVIKEFDALDDSRRLRIVQTLRTLQEQQDAYAKGRTVEPVGKAYEVTELDGVTKKSRHQAQARHGETACHAADLGVFTRDGQNYVKGATAEERALYDPILRIAEAHGLLSGQDWNCNGDRTDETFVDRPHVECHGVHAEPPPAAPAS